MDFASICRTCLKNNCPINPIFMCEDNRDRFSNAIYLGTGVQIKYNDGLPQNMCTACMKQLNNTLKFRKQCQEIETQLLRIKTELDASTMDSIVTNKTLKSKAKNNPKQSQIKRLTTQNCSNVTMKQEHSNIDFKTEPTDVDIDEDKPLKFFINAQTPSNMLLQNNDVNIGQNKNIISKEEPLTSINTEYFDEGSNLSENEEFSEKTEEIFCNNIENGCENTNTEPFSCVIYSRKLRDNDTKIKVAKKLLENNDRIKINDTEESNDEEFQTEAFTCSKLKGDCKKSVEAPYSFVTDSITKKTTRVVCKLCQKELSIRSIDTHMVRRHPGADERKVKCELCDKYVMRERLNRHRMMMHGSAGFRCGYCKSEFDTKDVLIEHVKTCTAKKRKRRVNDSGRELAECDVCNKTMQKASLKMHKAVKHAGLRPVCEHCGRSFGNKFRLNEHYRAKHGYEKFHCKYCDFRSAGIMGMRNHERRHRGEKPFVCETCGAKFHASYLLTQHKHSHRTEKLVKCDQCPASFKANNSLHMHKLTCHSNSLYRCTICARSYKCRYYAKKHVRLAHSNSGATPLLKVMRC